MGLIEPDDMRRYAEILNAGPWDAADVELSETDVTGHGSGALLPMRGCADIRRTSTDHRRAYATGDGAAWVEAFERDLLAGRFGRTGAPAARHIPIMTLCAPADEHEAREAVQRGAQGWLSKGYFDNKLAPHSQPVDAVRMRTMLDGATRGRARRHLQLSCSLPGRRGA